ncbi:MAG: hypothetical protein ACXWNI_02450 [Candidatus Limnocylindrales bacterium]
MRPSRYPRRRWLAVAAAALTLVALVGTAMVVGAPKPSTDPTGPTGPAAAATISESARAIASPTASPADVALATASPTASPAGSGFQPIDMFAPYPAVSIRSANPSLHPDFQPTDRPYNPSEARPAPAQPVDRLTLKAYGRLALVDGRIVTLGPTVDPMLMPGTGLSVPQSRRLDLTWTRWVVEPPGYGVDEKGNRYSNLSYWNLCGSGASTVALYYWQQLTGRPNVTGTEGYFLDPYAAEGVPWPSPGPALPSSGGKLVGTYWSGADSVSGFTAHGRGMVMYMAMNSQPPTWSATGISVWAAADGTPYYPTRGASLDAIQSGVNWELSGHDTAAWADSWYGTVNSWDPTLARDLKVAVMLDVGRDGVPVVAAIDTFDLPNWQKGASTRHLRHAVSIVGYDNTANPPTFSYLDSCGRSCNAAAGNQNGGIYVIPQSQMVTAIQDAVGIGFTW